MHILLLSCSIPQNPKYLWQVLTSSATDTTHLEVAHKNFPQYLILCIQYRKTLEVQIAEMQNFISCIFHIIYDFYWLLYF